MCNITANVFCVFCDRRCGMFIENGWFGLNTKNQLDCEFVMCVIWLLFIYLFIYSYSIIIIVIIIALQSS